ncbi:phage tail protein I [Sphingomonas melonis]|uniref:phage tail protein I n=1 Tax=Sphingomonas melonis TaxID=152682 RepID=UPI0035C7F0B3
MSVTASLLPPNATPFERSLEAAARSEAIDAPVDTLVDPARIAASCLPWLAYALSVDTWLPEWSEADKRAAVAESIALHRLKGTRASVEMVLARLDRLLRIVEWFEAEPQRFEPHTFDVLLPVAGDGVPTGGIRATAGFAETIISEVTRVKPLREHFRLVQTILSRAGIGTEAIIRPALVLRDDMQLVDDRTIPWEELLQAETGEPLQSDNGDYLETVS